MKCVEQRDECKGHGLAQLEHVRKHGKQLGLVHSHDSEHESDHDSNAGHIPDSDADLDADNALGAHPVHDHDHDHAPDVLTR